MQRAPILVVALAVLAGALFFLSDGGEEFGPGTPARLPGAEVAGPVDPRSTELGSGPAARRGLEGQAAAGLAPEISPAEQPPLLVEVVRQGSAAPLVGIEVSATAPGSFGRRWTAATDAAGLAVFAELPSGEYLVRAAVGDRVGRVAIRRGVTARLRIEVGPGVTLRGTVVSPAGRPIAGASVWLSEPWNDARGAVAARTGPDGVFEVAGAHRGQAVAAWAEGFAASSVFPVGIDTGLRSLRIVLSPATGSVFGTVRDEGGRGVADALVLVGSAERPFDRRADDGARVRGPAPREARTGPDGRFEIGHLEPGAERIQAWAEGFAPAIDAVTVRAGGAVDVALILRPGARLSGVCRGRDGRPLAGVQIATVGAPEFATRQAESAADGTFRIEDLPIGELEFGASTGLGEQPPVTVRLTAGAGADLRWDPVLGAAAVDPAEVVAGRVVGIDGRGLPGHRVVVEADPPQRDGVESTETGADGSFRIAVRWPQVRLLAFPAGGLRGFPVAAASGVARGSTGVELMVDVQGLSGLRARIVDTAGAPVGATLQIWHETARVWREIASRPETGLVEIEPIPAGTCSLELRSPDHPWLRLGQRELPAGRRLDLGDLVLQPGGRIEGTVTFVDGGQPSTLTLRFVDEAAGTEVGVAEVRDGSFRSNPLPLAALTMVVEGEGVAATRVPMPLDAQHPVRAVELRVERGIEVTLRFAFRPGVERPRWLNVGVFRESEAIWTRGLGPAAGLEVKLGLAPGRYRALAQGEGPLADFGFEVGGQPLTVEVPLGGR
jgi:hypothetical protein